MTALSPEQLVEIEAAARYGIDAAQSYFGKPCEPLNCRLYSRDPECALLVVPDREVNNAEWGLWARWYASEITGADEFGTVLRVRPRADRPDEPEGWRPGDVVLDAAGSFWTRVDHPDWPWASGADSVTYSREGSAKDARPPRPLVLLVRDGQPVGGAR